ncbi:MAG TPA: O-antigen ligase family protein [Bacteroidia bacterium]|nr:O-antigen ligase family protein [Bacteroidia bacterium]HNT80890.1 O-antigen ligase family protein [Bacteroidia bacterium]
MADLNIFRIDISNVVKNKEQTSNKFSWQSSILHKPSILFLFILTPIVFSNELQDNDTSLKLLMLSVSIAVAFFYYRKNNFLAISVIRTLTGSNIVKCYVLYLILSIPYVFLAQDIGDALYEFIRATVFVLITFLLVLHAYRHHNNKIPNWIFAIPCSALIFCLFGFKDLYEFIMEPGASLLAIKPTVSSTLGNKNFFAETLLFSLPFSLIAIYRYANTARYFFSIISIVSLFFIIVLKSVAVYIGLMIFVAFLLLFYFKSNKKFRILLAVLTLALVSIGIKIASDQIISTKVTQIIKGEINADKFSKASTFERMIMWRNSVKMIQEYPMGAGWTDWKILFPKYGLGDEAYMQEGSVKFINPHNDYLYMTAERSILSTLIFLAICFFSIIRLTKVAHRSDSDHFKFACYSIAAGIVSFLSVMLFSFPMERTYSFLLFSSFISMAIFVDTVNPIKKNQTELRSNWLPYIFLIVFLISFLTFAKRLNGEYHMTNSMKAQKAKQWSKMEFESKAALNFFYQYDFTATPIIWHIARSKLYQRSNENMLNLMIQAEQQSPYHVNILSDIGSIYYRTGQFSKATTYYQKVQSISPQFPDAIINLAVMQHNQNNSDSAMVLLSTLNRYSVEHQAIIGIILQDASKRWMRKTDFKNKLSYSKWVDDPIFLMYVYKKSLNENKDFMTALSDTLKKM